MEEIEQIRPEPYGQKAAKNAEDPPGQRLALGHVPMSAVRRAVAAFICAKDDDRARRRHGDSVDGRDDRRDGNCDRKLAEELSGDAAQEAARDEYRAQDERDRQYWTGYLFHGFDRGRAGVEAGGDEA